MSCHVIVMSRQRSLILESVTLVSHRIREQSRRDADTVTDYPVSYDVIESECGACFILCGIRHNVQQAHKSATSDQMKRSNWSKMKI